MNFDKFIVKRFSKYIEPELNLTNNSIEEKSLEYDRNSDTYKYSDINYGFVLTYNIHNKELYLTTISEFPGVTEKGYIFNYQKPIPSPFNIARNLQNKYFDIGSQLELVNLFYDKVKLLIDENDINISNIIQLTKYSKSTMKNYEFVIDIDEVKIKLDNKLYNINEINKYSEKLTKIAGEVYSVLLNSETLLSH